MAETRSWRWVLVPVTVGALVSLTAGLLARHQPRSTGYFQLFFSDPVAGGNVFTSVGCGSCHTLAAANAHGQIGPNLDRLKPPYDLACVQVERGGGSMPSFKGQLTPAQIRDVSAYVATYAGP